jgi:light-regulated signal transduction histidine kinase (bacteriophytochrome)
MNDHDKTNQQLITELQQLRHEIDSLQAAAKERAAKLVSALQEISSQNEEKGKRAAELIIANLELKFENEEKEKRAAELIIANIELAFQNGEKVKRAKELENANNDLEQFAYVANHDLQEPLRMISSYTQLLERKYKDKLDEDANEYIHFVVDGAIRIQKLLTDILEYSRISTRTKTFEQIDTSTVLGQVISNLQLLITENAVLITIDDLPVIKADASQILRVFQNLIENAIKFHKKTELPKIHISSTKQDKMYQFSVTDNGIGIEKQYHDRVFIVFQRLHSAKDYPGTGIGLSICKRIVERHGGTIWFESTVNEGATFYFTIPV